MARPATKPGPRQTRFTRQLLGSQTDPSNHLGYGKTRSSANALDCRLDRQQPRYLHRLPVGPPARCSDASRLQRAGDPGQRPDAAGANVCNHPPGAGLLARCIAWAGETDRAANEIFNVTNGDVFEWPNVWPAIAAALGFVAGDAKPLSLDREVRPQEAAWAEVRARYGLKSGSLKDFVGLSFEYADYTMGYGRDRPGLPAIVSTIKLMQAGFTEVMDTEAMFRKCFAAMQAKRLLPRP